jgi:hypothetical protein
MNIVLVLAEHNAIRLWREEMPPFLNLSIMRPNASLRGCRFFSYFYRLLNGCQMPAGQLTLLSSILSLNSGHSQAAAPAFRTPHTVFSITPAAGVQ